MLSPSPLVQRADLARFVARNCPQPEHLLSADQKWAPYSDSWLEIEAMVNERGLWSQETDCVIRPLLQWCRDRPGEESQSLILLMVWDSLLAQRKRLSRLDPDQEALWCNLTEAFLGSVQRVDLAQRPTRLGMKLLNDTQHDVRASYDRDRRGKKEGLDPPVKFGTSHSAGRGRDQVEKELQIGRVLQIKKRGDSWENRPANLHPDQEAVDCILDRKNALNRLLDLCSNGLISESDFQILRGCCLYGRSLREMATRLGVPYAVAKKRRQRAVGKIRKNEPSLSPDHPDSPLYQIESSFGKEVSDAPELSLSPDRE